MFELQHVQEQDAHGRNQDPGDDGQRPLVGRQFSGGGKVVEDERGAAEQVQACLECVAVDELINSDAKENEGKTVLAERCIHDWRRFNLVRALRTPLYSLQDF